MVGFDGVGVLLDPVQRVRDKLVQDTRVDQGPVGSDLHRDGSGAQRSGEEHPRGGNITPGAEQGVDDLTVLVDRAVQVRSTARDLHTCLAQIAIQPSDISRCRQNELSSAAHIGRAATTPDKRQLLMGIGLGRGGSGRPLARTGDRERPNQRARCSPGVDHPVLWSREAALASGTGIGTCLARRTLLRNCVTRAPPAMATTTPAPTAAISSAIPNGREPARPR